MVRSSFGLRDVPEPFRSILLEDHEELWVLNVDSTPPHPCDCPGVLIWGAWQESEILVGRLTARPRFAPKKRMPAFETGAESRSVSHSAQRLADAIVLATNSTRDPRTLTAWGQSIGVSRGALRVWCTAAGVSARSSLDFLRILRAIIRSEHDSWDLLSLLDVVDQRSLMRLLDRGSVRQLCRDNRPTVEEFMSRQKFLKGRRLVEAIAARLKHS